MVYSKIFYLETLTFMLGIVMVVLKIVWVLIYLHIQLISKQRLLTLLAMDTTMPKLFSLLLGGQILTPLHGAVDLMLDMEPIPF